MIVCPWKSCTFVGSEFVISSLMAGDEYVCEHKYENLKTEIAKKKA